LRYKSVYSISNSGSYTVIHFSAFSIIYILELLSLHIYFIFHLPTYEIRDNPLGLPLFGETKLLPLKIYYSHLTS
jgi:hypothetical protein